MATVTATGERAEEWRAVFGTATLPVRSWCPYRVHLPGRPGELVFDLDMAAVTPEVRGRLVAALARRFGLDEAEVGRDLDAFGVPLPVEGLMLTVAADE